MAALRVWLLGGFRAEVDGRPVPAQAWRRSRARQLVALLALTPAHRLHREQVMDALWPALGAEAAGANLRKAVHYTRRALGPDHIGVAQAVVRLGAGDLWVDVDAFERAAATADAEAGLAVYGGDLLPEDRYEAWTDSRRDELHGRMTQLLFDHAGALDAVGRRHEAAVALERLVSLDPLNEGAHCALVRLHALDGNRHLALQWYQQLAERLRQELGVAPGPEAQRLRDDVVAGRLAPSRPPAPRAVVEHRRVVSVLAADLPALATPDPEDHAAGLSALLDEAAAIVGDAGGVVETSVGARLIAVFGAPALGDDARRAVLAGERLLRAVRGARIGVASGWVVVREAAAPGTRIVGHVVQEAADAIASGAPGTVGFAADPLDAVPANRFVGRESDLAALDDLWERTQRTPALHVALVVGEPGIGKTRLVTEFGRRHADAPVRWAHCHPGGGASLVSPMAEILRAELALDPDLLERLEPDPGGRTWLRRRLRPLLDARPDVDDSRLVEPSEVVASWLRLIEGLTALAPRVFVFEDLHWADGSTLELLARALGETSTAPLLVICTARPEAFDRARRWLGRTHATAIALRPLATSEVEDLLAGEGVDPERTALVDRAGGNPLLALELARLVRHGRWDLTPLPASIRSVVTARLDALAPAERAVVQAAALAGDGSTPADLAAALDVDRVVAVDAVRALVRQEVLRSDGNGDGAVAFVHDVVREVATQQVTRATALELHGRLARWLDRTADTTTAGTSVRIAFQYHRAAAVATQLHHPDDAELGARAVHHLVRAADSLGPVDLGAALVHIEAAATVAPGVDPSLERRRGDILFALGRWTEASAALVRAAEAARAADDVRMEAEATTLLAEVSWHAGETAASMAALERSASLVERLPAGAEAASVLAWQGLLQSLTGHGEAALQLAERALVLARSGPHPAALTRALEARGSARVLLGDADGYDDFVQALEVATANGLSFESTGIYSDLAELHWLGETPGASLALSGKGLELASRRGLEASADWLRGARTRACFDAGQWDEALALSSAVLGRPADRLGQAATECGVWAARARLWRGDLDGAAELEGWFLPRARHHIVIQSLGPALLTAALVALACRRPVEAEALVDELLELTADAEAYRLMDLATTTRLLLAAGRYDTAATLVDGLDADWSRARCGLATARALLDRAAGRPGTMPAAAGAWAEYGAPLEEALAWAASIEHEHDAARRACELAAPLGVRLDDPAHPLRPFIDVR